MHAESNSDGVPLRKSQADAPFRALPIDVGQPIDVGEFRQGTPASQWALARYLTGRAIAESVGRTLLVLAAALVALAVLAWVGHVHVVAALLIVLVLAVLVMRLALVALLRRLTAFRNDPALDHRLHALVRDTRGDVLRELRRVGLPSHTVTLPLLAVRLLRRRTRRQTVGRLRTFRVDNVVPPARVDEMHLLLHNR